MLVGQLLDTNIERECPMDDKQTAYASDVSPDEYVPEADARVAYFHVVHGRSVRQVFKPVLSLVHIEVQLIGPPIRKQRRS